MTAPVTTSHRQPARGSPVGRFGGARIGATLSTTVPSPEVTDDRSAVDLERAASCAHGRPDTARPVRELSQRPDHRRHPKERGMVPPACAARCESLRRCETICVLEARAPRSRRGSLTTKRIEHSCDSHIVSSSDFQAAYRAKRARRREIPAMRSAVSCHSDERAGSDVTTLAIHRDRDELPQGWYGPGDILSYLGECRKAVGRKRGLVNLIGLSVGELSDRVDAVFQEAH